MSNRDKAKNPDYIGLALVTIAGVFAGIVGEIIYNEEGKPLLFINMMKAAAIGLGAALIFVETPSLLISLLSPLSALKDMIKADRRLLIALALIGGFVGEPVWIRGHEVASLIIDTSLNTLTRLSVGDSDNDRERAGSSRSPAEDKGSSRGANPSGNSTGQKAGQDLTTENLASEDNPESESPEGVDKERIPRPQDTGEAALTPDGIELEGFLDAGEVVETAKSLQNTTQEDSGQPPSPSFGSSSSQNDAGEGEAEEDGEAEFPATKEKLSLTGSGEEAVLPGLTSEDSATEPGSTEDGAEQERTPQSTEAGEAVLRDIVEREPSERNVEEETTQVQTAAEAAPLGSVQSGFFDYEGKKEVPRTQMPGESTLPGTVDPEPSESREAGPTTETEVVLSDSVEQENLEEGREKAVTRVLGYDEYQKFNDEYENMEKKRESLEKKRAEYEGRTRELESHLRSSQIAYRRCTLGKWQILHKAHLDDAENSRERLEERNEQLVKLNIELRKRNIQFESQRREIEKKHTIKGKEYKDEMRSWMDRIEVEYFFALENRLFRGYEEYQHGIDLYMIGIDGAAEACQKGDFTSRSMETFISFVREELR